MWFELVTYTSWGVIHNRLSYSRLTKGGKKKKILQSKIFKVLSKLGYKIIICPNFTYILRTQITHSNFTN